MSTAAAFASTPRSAGRSFAGASSTPSDLFTPGASGSRVDSVTICCASTTVNGTAEIYDYDGTTAFLIKTIPIPVTTIAAGTVSGFNTVVTLGIQLPTGHKLQCSVTLGANTLHFVAYGGDY